MDSAYRKNGELPDHYDISKPLQPEELIWLFSQLLGGLAAWHQGYLLTQTILSCRYIDNILQSEDTSPFTISFVSEGRGLPEDRHWSLRIVEAFCIALIKSISLAIDEIQQSRAPTWEDEDISTHIYGLTLFSKFDINVSTRIDLELKNLNFEKELPQHRRGLIQKLVNFVQALAVAMSNRPGNRARDSFMIAMNTIQVRHLDPNMKSIMKINSAFYPKLQQKYATSTPVRNVVIFDWESTYQTLRALCLSAQLANNATKDILVGRKYDMVSARIDSQMIFSLVYSRESSSFSHFAKPV
jgi:hypothetical protein